MFKKVGFILIFVMAIFSTNVNAHTGLEASTPANGEVVTTALQEVALTFETNIEETSSLQLVNSSGKQIEVSQVKVEDNLLKGSLSMTLPNDDYRILWKIVGEDGHLIEGEISFTVNVQEVVEPVKPAVENTEKPIEPKINKDEKEEASSKPFTLWLILPLGLLAGSTLWWLMRR